MLGQKIRDCRLQRHMSQQQLAGSELSRSMICLIEKGRCKPSWETLQILADRLGKPVEYFLDEQGEPAELHGLRSLLAGLEERPPDDLSGALNQAVTGTRLAQRLGEVELELKGTMLQGQFLMKAGQYDQAVERYEDAVELCRTAGNKSMLVQAMYQAGRALHFSEDLAPARRYYKRAARLAAGRKDLAELHVRILINLGSCCLRLDDGPGALEAYQEAVTLAWDHGLEAGLRGQAFIGLALAYRHRRDLPNAEKTAMLAVQLLTNAGLPLVVVARHNMAVILADQGRWEEAVPLFRECLEQFRQSGDVVRQAAVWEELARYHLHEGALCEAKTACTEALGLLDRQDDGILRGRVYRVLGKIAEASGKEERALELYRTGLEILRRVRATQEVAETQACIRAMAVPEPSSGKWE